MPVEIDVEKVALLARLRLSPEELSRFKEQLGVILEHAERVSEVAADDVPPTAHPLPRANVFRDDVVTPSLDHEAALANAPEAEDGRFRVPRIAGMD